MWHKNCALPIPIPACVTDAEAQGVEENNAHRESHGKESCMAESQPKKAGAYERPATRSSSVVALTIGIIAILVVIILAVLFLR